LWPIISSHEGRALDRCATHAGPAATRPRRRQRRAWVPRQPTSRNRAVRLRTGATRRAL